MWRGIKRVGLALIAVFFALFLMAFYWIDFRTPTDQIGEKLNHLPYQHHTYQTQGVPIHYVETGDTSAQVILFIHGAPGDWSAFAGLMRDPILQQSAHLISVDRPGYGHSAFGKPITSIRKQAEVLMPLLERLGKPVILVGHSFGGPIAAQLAALSPERIRAQVLIAPAIDPNHERIFWLSYPVGEPWLRWTLPPVWQVANDEKLTHVSELRQLEPIWDILEVPTLFLHGEKDYLVPIENSYYGWERLQENDIQLDTLFLPEHNHLIPFTHPEIVRDALLPYLQPQN